MAHPLIKNPHLNGDPFTLRGGPIGILLVHGLKATTAEMRPLGDYLNKKGFTISAPLLPGHNTSPNDANKYSWDDWVFSVESAYAELIKCCEQVFVGGESAGALLSMYLATNHPEISGIIAYAPALKLIYPKLAIVALHILAPIIPYIKEKDSDDNLPWRGYQAIPLKSVLQLLKLQRKTISRLEYIRRPILIVQGRKDARISPDVPEIIASQVSSAIIEVHWMEDSTHCVILDKELPTVQKITHQFIKRSLGYPHERTA
jgi:carboxylesterase